MGGRVTWLFLLCLAGCGKAMGIPVSPGTTVVFVGDSITADGWFDETLSNKGGTNLLVQQLSSIQTVARVGSATGRVGSASGHIGAVAAVTGGGQIYAINSGIGGNQASDIEAAVPARITNYNPDVVVIEVGINDVRAVPVPVTAAAFRASYDSIIEQTQAAIPTVQIVCLSILLMREQWASAPPPAHFAGNPFDAPADIPAFNAEIQASALAHGCVYVDTRPPAALLESTLNTPEPGAIDGILTTDGIHPNATGQESISDSVYPAFTFVPDPL